MNRRMNRPKTAIALAKCPKPNAARTWKQFEDHLIPSLRLSAIDRCVYSHLLRHSRLEGNRQLRFSTLELARRVRFSRPPVRDSVRRLIAYDVLHLVERTNKGHVVEVRLPHEIRAVRAAGLDAPGTKPICSAFRIERADFYNSLPLRRAIHAREAGLCFYCRKRLAPYTRCLDHVVPQVRSGRIPIATWFPAVRVSGAVLTDPEVKKECNSQKNQHNATDFLRSLYRDQRLTATELTARLRALESLAAGKLLPPLPPAKA